MGNERDTNEPRKIWRRINTYRNRPEKDRKGDQVSQPRKTAKHANLEGWVPKLQGLGYLGGLGAKTLRKTGSLEDHHSGWGASKTSHDLILYSGKTLK